MDVKIRVALPPRDAYHAKPHCAKSESAIRESPNGGSFGLEE